MTWVRQSVRCLRRNKERRTVRVDVSTMTVYPLAGKRLSRIGTVLRYTERQGARTPTGGIYTAHRLTVRLRDTPDVVWVGQLSNDELKRKSPRKTVILRPLDEEK